MATTGFLRRTLKEPPINCFDYAFNAGILDLAILDTVGHGLNSAVLAALLVGAYRHGRRAGDDFANLATRMDAAARTFPAEPAFATAILGRLDTTLGTLDWMSCGHPLPIVIREGAIVSEPNVRPGLPLGIGALGALLGDITRVDLQPGDGVLLYTDGVTECRIPDGLFFGEDRLQDLFAREHAAGASPHEVVRRLNTPRATSATTQPCSISAGKGDAGSRRKCDRPARRLEVTELRLAPGPRPANGCSRSRPRPTLAVSSRWPQAL